MNYKVLGILLFVGALVSCEKEECKECFAEETDTSTGIITTTSLGKKCGDELEEIDGMQYMGSQGPVVNYCE